MSEFRVIGIIDGDTFEVSPGWQWKGQSGTRVRPTGYDAPELYTSEGIRAKGKLSSLILNKTVNLGNAYKVDRGRLVCDVYFNGRNLADYFHQYQSST